MNYPKYLLAGDSALVVEFENEISPLINSRIRALDNALSNSKISGIVETVPTYCTLMIHYDPFVTNPDKLKNNLKKICDSLEDSMISDSLVLEIPVLYGGETGPDIEFVAQNAGISEDDVIKRHTAPDYLIYMLGFAPGFTYLGGLDESIAAPRLAKPRVRIPAGSVGIAGTQTGIYPLDSPGGWQIIGQTPVKMFNPLRAAPILPEAGQYIHFYPVDKSEFDRIVELENGSGYSVRSHPVKEVRK